ncbi:mothers against decapentaplegic homolog 7 isoform X2 [Leucoraja erinacea]|uniref:mothers against decapentaplegic homolog 7 isoform X2 n=1 Tax=Leucoraja erinaceus TaxID=7782 RepID=UPI0024565382|nr:mothers against decapentaplegic homolog 7 isoform X2 [Leucoraja erinacea]
MLRIRAAVTVLLPSGTGWIHVLRVCFCCTWLDFSRFLSGGASSRMFRTKRSGLVRRLWRSRALGEADGQTDNEGDANRGGGGGGGGGGSSSGGSSSGGCCGGKGAKYTTSDPELKTLTHSLLKKLKEKQLELLLQAVDSKGGARTGCLLLPRMIEPKLSKQTYSLPVLICKVFRWPDLRNSSELKRLYCCESYGTNNPDSVCCNPHHLSRLCEFESPPPPYSKFPMDSLKQSDLPDSVPPSTETGGTHYTAPGGLSESQISQELGSQSHWCVVAYWEERTRVGRLYTVQEPSLDIFYDLPHGNGFCLGQLNSDNKSQLVTKVRSKIGYGIQLSKEPDGVWVYNRSNYPIFIKSVTLDNPDSRTLLVHKVFPGYSIKAFDYEKSYTLQRPNDHDFTHEPWSGFSIQISFVKGWGQCYTRQFITSCPCWLEVFLNNR